MTLATALPDWAALLTSILLLLGAGLAFTGSLGLLRFKRFYQRVHAPTLATTLGSGCVLSASMIFFSVLQTRPIVHEILLAVFLTLTTPVTLMLLVRAALFRDRVEGRIDETRFRVLSSADSASEHSGPEPSVARPRGPGDERHPDGGDGASHR